jgi:hypothetical protein
MTNTNTGRAAPISALIAHIEEQQTLVCALVDLLTALQQIRSASALDRKTEGELFDVIILLAGKVNDGLDFVNLPDVEGAA